MRLPVEVKHGISADVEQHILLTGRVVGEEDVPVEGIPVPEKTGSVSLDYFPADFISSSVGKQEISGPGCTELRLKIVPGKLVRIESLPAILVTVSCCQAFAEKMLLLAISRPIKQKEEQKPD